MFKKTFFSLFCTLYLCSCGIIQTVPSEQLATMPAGSTAQFFYPTANGKAEAYLTRPKGAGPFPLMVLLHGHSFRGIGAERVLPAAETFAKELCLATLAISLPGYGLTDVPGGKDQETTLRVVLDGVAEARKLAWIDAKHVFLYGFSRGAAFAAMLAGHIKELSGLILHSGAYDLSALYRDTSSHWLRQILNPRGDENADLFSVLPEVGAWSAPTLILHGGHDSLIPVNQAFLLRDRLKTLGKPHRLVLFPENDHWLPLNDVKEKTLSFLKENLRSPCAVNGL